VGYSVAPRNGRQEVTAGHAQHSGSPPGSDLAELVQSNEQSLPSERASASPPRLRPHIDHPALRVPVISPLPSLAAMRMVHRCPEPRGLRSVIGLIGVPGCARELYSRPRTGRNACPTGHRHACPRPNPVVWSVLKSLLWKWRYRRVSPRSAFDPSLETE
jgi:hypothetical protein